MIRAKDLETMNEYLSNLGVPFKVLMERENVDPSLPEISISILDASEDESAIFNVIIHKEITGDYVVHDYEAKMLVVPIEHGLYHGIDTQKLEDKMKEIKWVMFPIYKKELLADILGRVDMLRESSDPKIKDIGDKLAIKYFSNTPLEEMIPLPDKKPYEKNILIPVFNKGNDVEFSQAVQLLRGETIIKFVDLDVNTEELCWLKEQNGYLKFYPDFNVAEVLGQMPLIKQPDLIDLSDILADMGNGKGYETSLLINSRIVAGSISVDPENKTLFFRDKTGRSVNWKLWVNMNQNKKPGQGKKGPGL